jgi:tetratricopeptide (TPR) repeat protein
MTTAPSADIKALADAAEAQLKAGDGAAALESYRALVLLRPDHADDWFNLGYLERNFRNHVAALAAYDRALALDIARPEEVHLNRALILSEDLYEAEAAETALREALAINPQFIAAWLNLGNLKEDAGVPDAALAAYEAVLAIDPLNGRALSRIAGIAVFRQQAEATLPRLLTAMENPQLPLADAVEVRFAVGQLLDAMGMYDEAYRAILSANDAQRYTLPPRYFPEAEAARAKAIAAAFPIAPAPPPPAEQPVPVFICGLFRSGSTLVEQMLGRHPAITPGGEQEYLPWLVNNRLQPWPDAAASLTPAALADLQRDYLVSLAPLKAGGGIVTDKRPDNYLHIGLIKAMFPTARIIHTVRRPIDNFLSIWFLHFGTGVRYGSDFDDMLAHYRIYLGLMRHWKQHFGADILDISYENLVSSPEPELRRMLDFVGLPWDPACLDPTTDTGMVRTASVWQVRQPLHNRSAGRWQNYAAHVGDLAAELDRLAGQG